MTEPIAQLRRRLAEVADLDDATHLLEWDQQTMMPERGAAGRAEALATLRRVSHEKFCSEETGRLLDAARSELNDADPEADDASLVRVAVRNWEKTRRVPIELVAERAKAASLGQEAWRRARAESDFASFAPHLERNLELARRYVECFDDFDCPYDALLDDFEPGMPTETVTRLFDQLKAELVPLIATLGEHSDRVDASWLHGSFPAERQRALVEEVVRLMGYDPAAWRIDTAVHPFASSLGTEDVRITTRWDETFFPSSLYSAMHECGHGLYEAGIDPALQRSPLGQIESLGLHESQSRLWENMVGRGRPFCGVLAPLIAEQFGSSLASRDAQALYGAVNCVGPSFIRVESDEATYSLHVILRFELEQRLIEGELSVNELPEAWDERFAAYFGLEVPDDAHGVLQDVHWSMGAFGYFPTYALGNLIAGQLWERVHAEVADLDERLAAGDLRPLREWLRERVHRHGAKFSMPELLARVVGETIDVEPFLAYLKGKLSDVYGLTL